MRLVLCLLAVVLLAGCARGGTVDPAVLAPPSSAAAAAPQPDRVILPRDDAPHNDLTEWWYYTGHLVADGGKTYGFELVMFQGERQGAPNGYAAHFALTDNTRHTFQFAQRSETGSGVRKGAGLDLNMNGWLIQGGGKHFHLAAAMPNYAIDLNLTALKPAVLHEGKGIISFGPAGDSYYYSRTRLAVGGTLTDRGQPVAVTGLAWMDHQWGNFISAGGGWDWFSMQLNDDSEVMLFFLRDRQGNVFTAYGTYVDPAGKATVLPAGSFSRHALSSWTSPRSHITYPSGWLVKAGGYTLTLAPTVKDQELRTAASTGVTYWEGDVTVAGIRGARVVHGQGYVELVGY
ncbi:MAG: lipocalin-like domain-containing protein [Chloroflexota bacterium]